jgi:protein TonB
MLAYAASRPRFAERKSSPNAMLGIIAAHVALVAVVMSAKMELPPRTTFTRTVIDFIPLPKEPPPKPIQARATQPPLPNPMPHPRQPDEAQPTPPSWNPPPLPRGPDASAGPGPGPQIEVRPNPTPVPQPTAARLLTPLSDLKPPYPPSKLLTEQEAVLKLRLTIDASGRVIAVDPVAAADRVFLEAARRHIIAHWRYRPATEDGRPVASSTVITLEFRLDG